MSSALDLVTGLMTWYVELVCIRLSVDQLDITKEYIRYGLSYCECGASGCSTAVQSRTSAEETLAKCCVDWIEHDDDGRLKSTAESGLIINSFSEFRIDSLKTRLGDIIEAQACTLVEHSKETFWLGADADPKCELEALAQRIFRFHTRTANADHRTSGAEWWVQVKSAEYSKENRTATAIDVHYDKDELIAEKYYIGIYPQISTVTYVTSAPHDTVSRSTLAPTLVLENTMAKPIGSKLTRAFVSRPVRGKHITFDGRYLHGVPSHPALRSIWDQKDGKASESTTESSDSISSRRVTFLVNIWLGHHPAGVNPLSDEIISTLPLNAEIKAQNDIVISAESPARFSYLPIEEYKELHIQAAAAMESFKIVNAPFGSELEPGSIPFKRSQGRYVRLPFVSEDATWGKADDSNDLVVKMWMPHSLRASTDTVELCYIEVKNKQKSGSKHVKLHHPAHVHRAAL